MHKTKFSFLLPLVHKHRCSVCGITFLHKKVLEKHKEIVHSQRNIYKCKICDSSFTDKFNLKQHTKSAHDSRKQHLEAIYVKEKCKKIVNDIEKRTLDHETNLMQNEIIDTLKSPDLSSDEMFKNAPLFNSNQGSKYQTESSKLCQNSNENHSNVVKNSNVNNDFRCSICDVEFREEYHQALHNYSVHSITKRRQIFQEPTIQPFDGSLQFQNVNENDSNLMKKEPQPMVKSEMKIEPEDIYTFDPEKLGI